MKHAHSFFALLLSPASLPVSILGSQGSMANAFLEWEDFDWLSALCCQPQANWKEDQREREGSRVARLEVGSGTEMGVAGQSFLLLPPLFIFLKIQFRNGNFM